MAARVGEEVFGEDSYLDATAETAAGHAVGEFGCVVLFGVAGEFGHVDCLWVASVMGWVMWCMGLILKIRAWYNWR